MRKFIPLYAVALLASALAIAGLAEWGQALYPASAAGALQPGAAVPATGNK